MGTRIWTGTQIGYMYMYKPEIVRNHINFLKCILKEVAGISYIKNKAYGLFQLIIIRNRKRKNPFFTIITTEPRDTLSIFLLFS